MCFLSLPPSITVVSEKDNLFNNNNKTSNTTQQHNYVSFAPILLDDVLHRMEKINILNKNYTKNKINSKFGP